MCFSTTFFYDVEPVAGPSKAVPSRPKKKAAGL